MNDQGPLNYIEQIVKDAKKVCNTEESFLNYCNERLPITYPNLFLKAYWNKLKVQTYEC